MKKVLVGMSGGVDSSVAAALLLEQGFKVEGVFVKVWEEDASICNWREERRDALRAAAHLGIPLATLDLSEEYKRAVVNIMVEEYRKGRTPNPDILCNREIKFGALWDYARSRGFEALATGHYAQTDGNKLILSADENKDQTYFLWKLTSDDLKHILFPVGGMKKSEVRDYARMHKFPNAEKKDSQGICFVGPIDVKEFLREFIREEPGEVLDTNGKVIGNHSGAALLTLGERRGFSVTDAALRQTPLYVVAKNMEANTITVSPTKEEGENLKTKIFLENSNWISDPIPGKEYGARLRHRAPLIPVTLDGSLSSITFNKPVLAAPGQSIVLYDGQECLGGGIIV